MKVSVAAKLSRMPALLIRTSILGLGEELAGAWECDTFLPAVSWPHEQEMDGKVKEGRKKEGRKEGYDNRVIRRS